MVDKDFNVKSIDAHNNLRKLHGCPPLTYNAKIARSAQNWADSLAERDVFQHSPKENHFMPLGENIAMKGGRAGLVYEAKQAADEWYSEIEFYNFSEENQVEHCGHFSQVVWKSTEEAGFGWAESKSHKIYVVGQYSPPGNWQNQWRANVPFPLNGVPFNPCKPDQKLDGKGVNHLDMPDEVVYLTSGPRNKGDFKTGSSSKTKIANGQKVTIVTENFITPSGETYSVIEEVKANVGKDKKKDDFDDMMIKPKKRQMAFAAPPKSHQYPSLSLQIEDVNAFRRHILDLHNEIRGSRRTPELKLDLDLCARAQDWADHLSQSIYFSRDAQVRYRDDVVGQSIAILTKAGGSPEQIGTSIIESWEGESMQYDYDSESRTKNDIRNFCQMVWHDTKVMGCGMVRSEPSYVWFVCFYHPAGCIQGRFQDNVHPVFE